MAHLLTLPSSLQRRSHLNQRPRSSIPTVTPSTASKIPFVSHALSCGICFSRKQYTVSESIVWREKLIELLETSATAAAMLDGLLGRGAFYTKCKSLIKMTRTRIEAISRRRKATEKFLRKDIADLLACGLESNAYGRIGGLVAELVLTSCYDFIDYVCEIVLKQLSVMQKHRECPEDCREAVASLMYAAARFSDLPELRDLRNVLQERYGSSLEFYVNQKLVKNITPKPPSDEKKLQLMQDIVSEFSIKWDAHGFEQRMSNASVSRQDPPKSQAPLDAVDCKFSAFCVEESVQKFEKLRGWAKKRNEVNCQYGGGEDVLENKHQMHVGKDRAVHDEDELNRRFNGKELETNRSKQPWREETPQRRKEHVLSSPKRQHIVDANGSSAREISDEPKHKVDSWLETAGGDRIQHRAKEINLKKDSGVPSSRRKHAVDKHDSLNHDSTAKPSKSSTSLERPGFQYGPNQLEADWDMRVAGPRGDSQKASPQVKIEGSSSNHGVEVLPAVTISEAKADGLKSDGRPLMPPPYIKPSNAKHKAQVGLTDGEREPSKARHKAQVGLTDRERGLFVGDSLASLDGNATEKLHNRHSIHTNERHATVQENATNGHDGHTDEYYRDHGMAHPTPRRRSSRRKHTKPKSSPNGNSNAEDEARVVRGIPTTRRRGESRKGLQILFDDYQGKMKDEEEKIIDKLLLHYSQKRPTVEPAGPRRHSTAESADARISSVDRARHQNNGAAVAVTPLERSRSLPRQQETVSEPTKVFSRATSFQPEMLTPAKHVHPKLPDYDDLAARFAALKRNKE
ncbi:IST1-like protein [Drosera capensis]